MGHESVGISWKKIGNSQVAVPEYIELRL